jgi:antitoxin component YwqK of YwqJK toxin-antitoxin module
MYLVIPSSYITGLIYGSWNNFKEPFHVNSFNFTIESMNMSYNVYYIECITNIAIFYITDVNRIILDNFPTITFNNAVYNIISFSEGYYINANIKIIKTINNGEFITIFDNDKKILHGPMVNNMPHGEIIEYNNDMMVYKRTYMNGLATGPGFKFVDNTISCFGSFLNGKLNGIVYEYYPGKIPHYKKKYDGVYFNNLKHGKGIEYHMNGNVKYDGYFVNDMYEGIGKLYNENKILLYSGNFKSGIFNGEGIKYKDDSLEMIKVYSGSFINSLYQGEGTLYYETGHIMYNGEFINNMLNGTGFEYYSYDGGIKYEGHFVNNKYSGNGTEFYNGKLVSANIKGKKKYIGAFNNGLYNGLGEKYNCINGNLQYKGFFINGRLNGTGEEYYISGTLKYKGTFENNMYNGYGELYMEYGVIKYKGIYTNGKLNGHGKEFFESGNIKYVGEFINDMKEGEGIEYNKYGGTVWHKGMFKENLYDGYGIRYNIDGTERSKGIYVKGFYKQSIIQQQMVSVY